MFDEWPGARGPLFRRPELASDIDALDVEIYPAVNNGVLQSYLSRRDRFRSIDYDGDGKVSGQRMDVGWEILSVLAPVVCVSLFALIVPYALSRAPRRPQ